MGYKEMYEEWLNNPYFDDATKAELKAIEGNEKEIEDRFYMDLEFGTAGLRGCVIRKNLRHSDCSQGLKMYRISCRRRRIIQTAFICLHQLLGTGKM